MQKFFWLCPILTLALAVWVLILFGFTIPGAILAALVLACLAIIMWGAIKILRNPVELPLEPAPHTRGMLFDWAVPVYDWYCRKLGIGPSFRNMTLQHAGVRPGERVLDVGCGTGVLTRLAAKAVGPGGSVIGIDPGPRMIGVARKNAAVENSRAAFRLAAIEELPFEDNSFDCVLSSFMIHHLPPELKIKGLKEVHRVLKPGGRLLAVDIGRPSNHTWWIIIWPLLLWSNTREQITGRLDDYFLRAGFRDVRNIGHWKGIVSFWLAGKSGDKGGGMT